MKPAIIPLLLFSALVAFLAVGLTLDPSRVPSPLIGRPAPAFSAERLSQPGVFVNEKDFLLKPALFNVWATWCSACLDEHPLLMDLARRRGVPVYGLNYKDDRRAALGWLEQFGNPYRWVAYDGDARVGIEWGVYGAPETYLISADGVVLYKHIGALNETIVEQEILPLLKRKSRRGADAGGDA